jgi:hypothetical protein
MNSHMPLITDEQYISEDDLITISPKSVTTSYFILVVAVTGITIYSSLVSW